jgi:DNA primase
MVSLAQFSVIKFHTSGAPSKNLEKPDNLTWDLNPEE